MGLAELVRFVEEPPYPKAITGFEKVSFAYFLGQIFEKKSDSSLVAVVSDEAEGLLLKQNLEFFLGEKNQSAILWFPPFDNLPDILAARLRTLQGLLHRKNYVLIASWPSLLENVLSKDVLKINQREICCEDLISRDELVQWLMERGYPKEVVVESPGDFAVRGNIIDCFSPQEASPVRIELDGDTICSIRFFDPATQTSLPQSRRDRVSLLPASENFSDSSITASLFDYLDERALFFLPGSLLLEKSFDSALQKCRSFPHVMINAGMSPSQPVKILESFSLKNQWSAEQYHQWRQEGMEVEFVCHTDIQAIRLKDLLSDQLKEAAPIKVGKLSNGFGWIDEKKIILTEEELFGHKTIRKVARRKIPRRFNAFAELKEGDLLVHEDYGISRYLGLKHLKIHGMDGDYLQLEFFGRDKVYLPVHRLDSVQRYIGSAKKHLDSLGGVRWKRVKARAGKEAYKVAQELLKIHAQREAHSKNAFSSPDTLDEEFASHFPYDETPDQDQAIKDVYRDLQNQKPMDRLICGDVGYGKTEVAMRAAFKVVSQGRQVAFLVPTTILALQHFETFQKRFDPLAVSVEMLSRFKTRAEQKVILQKLAQGKLDIVIGTHRLLMKDIAFADLGLLILDEEHRFGVRHKEKIKKLRPTVDVLTLSATPIPRTLHMSLIGIKDLSVIETPPVDRLAIRTYIARWDEALIRRAIEQELARDGQVFFVHNRVNTLPSIYEKISKMFPQARIAIGHGQMNEKDLEKVMIDFLHQRIDIFITTTIIESGIDVPSANTMLINRADTFGLAQLYQLRGRVGRSQPQAFCYLLVPDEEILTADSKKRLEALTRYTELGAGFQIAQHDLEIRGAGNLLGESQSGLFEEIGYEMYMKLLSRAIRELKGEKKEEEVPPEIQLKVSAFIPQTYVESSKIRMELYKRGSHIRALSHLKEFEAELIDRFGPLPHEVSYLLQIIEIKILGFPLKVSSLKYDGKRFIVQIERAILTLPQAALKNPQEILEAAKKMLRELSKEIRKNSDASVPV